MKDSIQIVEEMYPQTAAEFKAMTDEMYKVFCAKMYDYGANNIALGRDLADEHNKKLSLMGIWFRSNDKMARIENLLQRKDDAANESLEDSYLDLANYSVIASIVRKNLWGK